MMLYIGIVFGILIAGPVCLAIGFIHGRDVTVRHEPADIRPALRRSSR